MGIPTDCLRIGDFARLGGTNLRTLRYYEQLGLMSPTARSDGGFRYYRRSDPNRLSMIRDLQGLGMKLSGISELMDTRREGSKSDEMLARVHRALTKRHELIEAQIAHLNEEREQIKQAMTKLVECQSCDHRPSPENNFCEPCIKSGLSLPNDLSALY